MVAQNKTLASHASKSSAFSKCQNRRPFYSGVTLESRRGAIKFLSWKEGGWMSAQQLRAAQLEKDQGRRLDRLVTKSDLDTSISGLKCYIREIG